MLDRDPRVTLHLLGWSLHFHPRDPGLGQRGMKNNLLPQTEHHFLPRPSSSLLSSSSPPPLSCSSPLLFFPSCQATSLVWSSSSSEPLLDPTDVLGCPQCFGDLLEFASSAFSLVQGFLPQIPRCQAETLGIGAVMGTRLWGRLTLEFLEHPPAALFTAAHASPLTEGLHKGILPPLVWT